MRRQSFFVILEKLTMWDKIKQFFLRLLLLVAKSFVYLWQWLKTSEGLSNFFSRLGTILFSFLLLILSPFYKLYRRVRRVLTNITNAKHSHLIRLISHRYVLHVIVAAIAVTITITNIRLAKAEHANFGRSSLVFAISNNDTESTIDTPSLNTPEAVTELPTVATSSLTLPLNSSGSALFQIYLPSTSGSVAPRTGTETYTIESGDTLAGIASRFHLSINTLLSANNLTARSVLRVGQKITILPTDGVLHVVKRGEQLATIARQYQVSVNSVLAYNNVSPSRLAPGTTLIIPGGKPLSSGRPTSPPPTPTTRPGTAVTIPKVVAVDGGTTLLWPTTSHRINQYFTYRHNGLDIHGVMGGPVYASDDGVVLESRWATGYGNMILIKHDNGLITRYGHSSKLLVTRGERIKRGQLIALVGSTGRSTGPHIHLEVIVNGRTVNPLKYTR